MPCGLATNVKLTVDITQLEGDRQVTIMQDCT